MEQLYKKHKHINKQWAEIVEQRMETLYTSLQNGISSIQFKEIEDLSSKSQIRAIRKVYRKFGDLLYYWPEIYACVETRMKTLIE